MDQTTAKDAQLDVEVLLQDTIALRELQLQLQFVVFFVEMV